jgi:hypothetical protein
MCYRICNIVTDSVTDLASPVRGGAFASMWPPQPSARAGRVPMGSIYVGIVFGAVPCSSAHPTLVSPRVSLSHPALKSTELVLKVVRSALAKARYAARDGDARKSVGRSERVGRTDGARRTERGGRSAADGARGGRSAAELAKLSFFAGGRSKQASVQPDRQMREISNRERFRKRTERDFENEKTPSMSTFVCVCARARVENRQ